jgi:Na+-transporting NADH:ubiquinone oxidoreductase subunit F
MSSVIITSIVAFTIIILLLVFVLLFAQSKLVSSGDVKIIINGDEKNPLIASAGSTLLSTLGNKKIFLPSACGGGGTCAMCKCTIEEGGGEVLPTEEGHLSRAEKQTQVRLSCQVKVKNDMKIRIPEEIFGIKKWECEVISNYNVSTFIKEFKVKLPEGEILDFEPGGYIQIDVPVITVTFDGMDIAPHPELEHPDDVYQSDWDKFGLWDLVMKNDEELFRAYSMANHPAEGNIVMLTIRIATPPWDRANNKWMDVNPGIASSYIFAQKEGDKVTISGPYGEFFIHESESEMLYVGGGAGMAPLRSQIFDELKRKQNTSAKMSFWYGARSLREMFYTQDFDELDEQFENFDWHVALSDPLPEDNWSGDTGFIHNVLYDRYLKDHPAPEDCEFYMCGPPMMNAACVKLLTDLGVEPENIMLDDFGG